MSADLALQKAIRARLVDTPAVTAMVPADNILDRNARPAPATSIVLGESQSITGSRLQRDAQRVYATLHIWKKEGSTAGVKEIAGAVRTAIHAASFGNTDGYHFGTCFVSDARFMRDPDGETSHGVVTVEALLSGG